MKFKGGKGIAVMAALTVSNCFWHLPYSVLMFFITLAFFAVPVAVTRYISLGSLLAYAAFFIEMVVFGQLGWFVHTGIPSDGTCMVASPCEYQKTSERNRE